MNSTEMTPGPALGARNDSTQASPTAVATQAATTAIQVLTTAASSSVTAVHAVVIVIFLLTIAAAIFLAYRYFCHDKGDYRLSGEVTPWEEPVDADCPKSSNEKKEYFI